VTNLSIISVLYFGDRIGRDNFDRAIDEINSLYIPYLGAILAHYFATRGRSRRQLSKATAPILLAGTGDFTVECLYDGGGVQALVRSWDH
jgi:hypothetical protein